MEKGFYDALLEYPNDLATWMGLHDWLEECNDPRVDFVKQQLQCRGHDIGESHAKLHQRVQTLLEAGHRPCVPIWTNSIGMQLVQVNAGTFTMGSPPTEAERDDDEQQHEVEITKDYFLGIYPVTQRQWRAVMGNNPSWYCATGQGKDKVKGMNTDDFPVECVSWEDAQTFLNKLNEMEKYTRTGRKYRLPTEAEWEYACRGGHLAEIYQVFHFGDSLSSDQANFYGNFSYDNAAKGPYLKRTCAVNDSAYKGNALGLYHMHGNVWEWCLDWYANNYYGQSPLQDPGGPPNGSNRVNRGGSWNLNGLNCRSANRGRYDPTNRNYNLGFRVAAERVK